MSGGASGAWPGRAVPGRQTRAHRRNSRKPIHIFNALELSNRIGEHDDIAETQRYVGMMLCERAATPRRCHVPVHGFAPLTEGFVWIPYQGQPESSLTADPRRS